MITNELNNLHLTELNEFEKSNIAGGTWLSYYVAYALASTWKFISTPGAGSDTLMNCI